MPIIYLNNLSVVGELSGGFVLLEFYKKKNNLFGSFGTSQMLINWKELCQYFCHMVAEKNMHNRNVLCNESSNTVSIQITALWVDYIESNFSPLRSVLLEFLYKEQK